MVHRLVDQFVHPVTDIIERAEKALEGQWPGQRIISPARFFGGLVRELVAELNAARAEIERLKEWLKVDAAAHREEVDELIRGQW